MRAGSRTCECARDYVSKCRLRLLHHIPKAGEKILDMASGPIQYPEYLEFSKGFTKRYCVDLSSQALESAEKKLGEHGVYLCGSFFELEFAPETFDCAISLHTIYHMDRDLQELAVRKLIAVCKPGAPVIIVYSNPQSLITRLEYFPRKLKAGLRKLKAGKHGATNNDFYSTATHSHGGKDLEIKLKFKSTPGGHSTARTRSA